MNRAFLSLDRDRRSCNTIRITIDDFHTPSVRLASEGLIAAFLSMPSIKSGLSQCRLSMQLYYKCLPSLKFPLELSLSPLSREKVEQMYVTNMSSVHFNRSALKSCGNEA